VLPAPQGSRLLLAFLAVREVEMAGRLFFKMIDHTAFHENGHV